MCGSLRALSATPKSAAKHAKLRLIGVALIRTPHDIGDALN